MPKPAQGGAGEPQDRSGQVPDGGAGAAQEVRGRTVAERKKKYLVAPRQPMAALGPMAFGGLAPLPLSTIEQALRANPDIEVVDTVGARSSMTTAGLDGAPKASWSRA